MGLIPLSHVRITFPASGFTSWLMFAAFVQCFSKWEDVLALQTTFFFLTLTDLPHSFSVYSELFQQDTEENQEVCYRRRRGERDHLKDHRWWWEERRGDEIPEVCVWLHSWWWHQQHVKFAMISFFEKIKKYIYIYIDISSSLMFPPGLKSQHYQTNTDI